MTSATLSIRTPRARMPVLVWTIREGEPQDASSYFVDALTGAYLTPQQVLHPLPGGDATLDAGERALKHALQRPSPLLTGGATPWMHFIVLPILEAKDVFECNTRGGMWTLLRMCIP